MGFEKLLNVNYLLTFFLITIRVNGILFTAPVFGSRNFDPRLRLFFSVFITLLLINRVELLVFKEIDPVLIILLVVKEILIGVCTGLLALFIFTGIQFGGQIIGFQMGFGVVNILDPQTNTQVSIIAQFKNILMILIFLAIGGHNLIIKAIAYSFERIPLASFTMDRDVFAFVVKEFGYIFLIALKIIAPVFVTLILLHVVMGIMARLVPQMNILIVGFPVQIAFGLTVLLLSLTYFYNVFERILYSYFKNIDVIFRMIGG